MHLKDKNVYEDGVVQVQGHIGECFLHEVHDEGCATVGILIRNNTGEVLFKKNQLPECFVLGEDVLLRDAFDEVIIPRPQWEEIRASF